MSLDLIFSLVNMMKQNRGSKRHVDCARQSRASLRPLSVVARATTRPPKMNDLAMPNIADVKGLGAIKDLGMDSQGDLKDLSIRDVKVIG